MKKSKNTSKQLILFAIATIFLANSIGPSLFASSRPGSLGVRNELRATTPVSTLLAPEPVPADEALLAYRKLDLTTFQYDIFRQRADGSNLLNLTNDPAPFESEPVWSPDGSKIAFVRVDFATSTSSLRVMNADGSNLVVLTNVTGESVGLGSWSPDSSKLVFQAQPPAGDGLTGEVFVINADGTGRFSLSGSDGLNTQPQWSPDGSRISYLRGTYSPSSPTINDIYVANPDGSNQIKIAHADSDRDFGASWSPAGTKLAFTRYLPDNTNDIYTVNADGSNQQRLTNDATIHTYSPQWTPNGTRLSFGNTSVPGTSIEVMNADGSGRMTLYTPPQGGLSYDLQGFTWSPDSAKVALWFSIGEGQGANACVINSNGTGLQCFGSDTEGNGESHWSPDGARIAFLTARSPNSSGIDIINADGSGRVPLTSADGLYGAPQWRPTPSFNTPAGTNVTVTVGGVQFTFANVTTAGQTTVTPIDPATAGSLPGGYTLFNGSLAFQITTTAIYSGSITVCLVDASVNDPTTFASLRILHGEGGTLVDRTILSPDTPAPNFSTRTLCARVTSLSPFVVAKLTYGVQVLFDQTKPVKSGATLPVKFQLTNASGANVSSASLVVTALSVLRVSTNTSGDVQDSGNANPDNNFRYAGGSYIYNLSTKGYASGTYLLRFRAGTDVVNYTVQFQVK